jgi:DNA-binding transcriptional regulator LsrR (DeoR family)
MATTAGAEDMMASDYDDARLISRVLYLYYIEELTQSQVAQQLGLSTPKVNRLLQQARRQKMVEITIRTPFQYLFDLETRLQNIFNIREAVVIPRVAENAATMVHTLGRAGANYLLEHLHDGDVIAIGGGTTVHAVVEAVNPNRTYDVDVVPVVGGVQGRVTTDVNYLAAQLAERLGGRAYQLHTPVAETSAHRAALLEMAPIKEILDIARRANICLLGIGMSTRRHRALSSSRHYRKPMNQIMTMRWQGEILAIVWYHRTTLRSGLR